MPIHVAILLPRYIRLILDGRKTVESRLTRSAKVPFRRIEPGEHIYFKASGGPYMATALADKVRFIDNLTPDKVAQLKTRYNDRVRGDDAYWHSKRDSRYATFILLKKVQPITRGPDMPPSPGPAWFVLDDAAAPRIVEVTLTAGAIRNGYLRVPRKVHAFPEAAYSANGETARKLTLQLPDGDSIQSDLVCGGMIRWRGWKSLYLAHQLTEGDIIQFHPRAGGTYRVQFIKRNAR